MILRYVVFCGFLSLSITSSRSIHTVAGVSASFLRCLNNIPLYGEITFCLFIHSWWASGLLLPFGCYKSCSCGHSLYWIPHCGSPAAMFPTPSCPVIREADLNAASQWLLVGFRSKGRRSRQGIYLSGPLPRGPVCWLLYTTPSPSLPHSAQVNSNRRYYRTAFLFLPLLDPLILYLSGCWEI